MNPTTEKYILYADDDRDDQELLRETLLEGEVDLRLVTVNNGLELIQFLSDLKDHQYFPCFIVLDINMPVWDGFRTLQALKAHREWETIPVIMFSTSSMPKDAELAVKSGAHKFVTKPFGREDLKRVSDGFAALCLRQPSRKKQLA